MNTMVPALRIVAALVSITTASAALQSPPDSARRPVARVAPPPAVEPALEVSGYLQAFYKTRRDATGDASTEPSVFRLQRVRLQFKGAVNRHVSYEIEVDPRSPEVAGLLRDAFVSLDYVPRHELRIGQQKTLFGYENPTSSSRLYTVNRAEISEGIGRGANLRDIGVSLLGSVPVRARWRFEDAISVVNGSGMNVQADSTPRKNVWSRVGARYRHGEFTMRVGVSAGVGDQIEPPSAPGLTDGFKVDFTRVGADVQIDHPRLWMVAEFATADDRGPSSQPDVGGRSRGFYVLIVPRTRWRSGPIIRYDTFDEFRRWTVGVHLGRPSDDVSVLFNYESLEDDLGKHDDKLYLRLQVRLK